MMLVGVISVWAVGVWSLGVITGWGSDDLITVQ